MIKIDPSIRECVLLFILFVLMVFCIMVPTNKAPVNNNKDISRYQVIRTSNLTETNKTVWVIVDQKTNIQYTLEEIK